MFVCCKCCVLSSRGLCDGPIPRPEESYRLWCVILCDQVKNNPLHLPWLGRKGVGLRKKDLKKLFTLKTQLRLTVKYKTKKSVTLLADGNKQISLLAVVLALVNAVMNLRVP